MLDLTLAEAQLFRMLSTFFGSERIVPHMSVLAVCGGALSDLHLKEIAESLSVDNRSVEGLTRWARENRCLFTVVDDDDEPKLVIEFAALNEETVEADKLEYQKRAQPLLKVAGVPFLTIRDEEFEQMLNPSGNLDLVSFLKGRFEEMGFSFGSNSD